MNKIWIFFKLRILQLKYDKTALFFSYFLPVILLTGIGFPMELANNKTIDVYYADTVGNAESTKLIKYLKGQNLINLKQQSATDFPFKKQIEENKISHFLYISKYYPVNRTGDDTDKKINISIYLSDARRVAIENLAVSKILNEYFVSKPVPEFIERTISSGAMNTYIATLLPGLIGMTLLTIGLNGFGGVLIVEFDSGLFRNIKTIDASPFPFLGGLFFSRLFVCYTVAIALYILGVFMFGLKTNVDFLLLLIVVTIGCTSFLGIGLLIAVFSKSVSAFNGIVNFVNIPFVVFSGVFFSIIAFPEWLQMVAQVIPLTHMNTAVKAILFEQISLSNIEVISKELILLSIWCVATIVLGLKKFKW